MTDKFPLQENLKHKNSSNRHSTLHRRILLLLPHLPQFHPLSRLHHNLALPSPSSRMEPNPSPIRLTFHRKWEPSPTRRSLIIRNTNLLLSLHLPSRTCPSPLLTNLSTSPLLDSNPHPRPLNRRSRSFNTRPTSLNRRRWRGWK